MDTGSGQALGYADRGRPVPGEDWNAMDHEVNAGEATAQAQRHPARLRVGVIGTGRVGSALGAVLARAGHTVVAASGVSEASVRRAHSRLPGVPLREPPEVAARAELILLTVPDDALPGLVAGLAATGAELAGRLLVHTSGRYGIGVLEPAVARGALPLALHPVMTFTGRPDDIDRLEGICFGVTAPDQLQPVAEALVIEMGGEPVLIREEDRGLYHAALASASNHLVGLVAEAADLLRSAGAPNPARMLGPLLYASLDNALRLGDAGLSGPVARGDADTVARHIEVLGQGSPRALGAYLALARLTAGRALDAGLLASSDAQRLLDVLADLSAPAAPSAPSAPGVPDERRDPGDGLGPGDGDGGDPGDGRDPGEGRDSGDAGHSGNGRDSGDGLSPGDGRDPGDGRGPGQGPDLGEPPR
jgi:predicted short-subunit dehydrogenase-like oxidoreductase (DUF2520 family)